MDQTIGAEIKTRRAAAGLTQAQLASALGVIFQQVQKYERGTNRVSAATLLKVAEFLGCSVADLYGDPDPGRTAESERTILKIWQQLHDPQREAVVMMLRAFVQG